MKAQFSLSLEMETEQQMPTLLSEISLPSWGITFLLLGHATSARLILAIWATDFNVLAHILGGYFPGQKGVLRLLIKAPLTVMWVGFNHQTKTRLDISGKPF